MKKMQFLLILEQFETIIVNFERFRNRIRAFSLCHSERKKGRNLNS